MAINFSSEYKSFKIKHPIKLKSWIKVISAKEKKEVGDISYVFVTDEALLKINMQYLNHFTYTDIITFDYSDKKSISGDIYISIDRVGDNAKKFNVDFDEELRRVMIHGVLHLCGYKDKTKAESDKMRVKENHALSLFDQ